MLALKSRARRGKESSAADVYTVFVGLALVVALLLTAVGRSFGANGGHLAGSPGWVPWGLAVAWASAFVLVCTVIGPVSAGPQIARWLLPTPLDRAGLLRGSFRLGVLSSIGAGAVGGTVVVVAAGASEPLPLVAGAVVGVVSTHALYLMTVRSQRAPRRPVRRLDRAASAMLLCSCVAIIVGVHAGVAIHLETIGWPAAGAVFLVAMTTVIWAVPRRRPWLQALKSMELVRGGQMLAAVTGSVTMLDEEVLRSHGDRSRLARRSTYLSRRGRGGPLMDILLRDVTGCLRRGAELLSRLSLVLIVWVAGTLFGKTAAVVTCGVVAYLVGSSAALKLRTWLGSTSLWRFLPQPPRRITVVLCVVPTILSALVGALAGVGGPLPVGAAVTMGFSVTAGLVRRSGRPPTELGLIVFTSAGALPVGLLRSACYGIDLVALCLAAGLAFGWAASGVLAAVCLTGVVLRARPGGERSRLLPQRVRFRLQQMGIQVGAH